MSQAKVAIVGRPNVGKSTLFNRLAKKRKAIVQKEHGTTRDRLYESVSWDGTEFQIIDTGGHKLKPKEPLSDLVNEEVLHALDEADVLLFVSEKDGITSEDLHIAKIVKKKKKPVVFAVNKVDNDKPFDLNDIYQLGLGEPVFISAAHGLNIEMLLEKTIENLPKDLQGEKPSWDFRLTIIGEPNAGKSTLMNKMLNQKRAIVSDIPGTTRDYVEELIEVDDYKICLTDTAGIKKKFVSKDVTTFFSLKRAKEAIKMSDVVILLFDVEKGLQRETRTIFETIEKKKKSCILVGNKWDLTSREEMGKYEKRVKERNGFLKQVPMVFISALKGRNVTNLLKLSTELWEKYTREIKTSELNDFLQDLKTYKLPVKCTLKYMVQSGKKPPAFLIFMKNKKSLKKSNIRYISNQLIEKFNLQGIFPQITFK